MIKLTGSIIVIICGYYFGIMQADKLKRLCTNLGRSVKMLNDVYIMLDSSFSTREEIFQAIMHNEEYVFFENLLKGSEENNREIPKEDFLRLKKYFLDLGSTDINGELMKTRLCINELTQSEKILCEKYHRCNRLYKAMGLLSGIIIVLIII